ncbi:MAG TPA: MoaD/ThiS family protein [Chloroflexi bacterium]|nr:MoaD/ThiS family protein [Chloroflexota bacterium]
MRITVKLFAGLGQYRPGQDSPGRPFELTVKEGTTVGEVIRDLGLPTDLVKVVFVNGRAREDGWELKDGDTMGVFPPVGGG